MGALNSFTLWGWLGVLGIAVPVIIHLLYRKHRRQTDWAAMELLRRALVIRSGQVKLEDFLILFLRCLCLALLALALLRPTLSSDGLIGTDKVGMVVAVDASYSMNHGEHSRFERAVEKAKDIVSTANEGDPLSLVLMSNRPEVLLRSTNYVPNAVEDVLENQMEPTPYRLGLERNIELLEELVAELKTPGKECYLVTDAQELDWASLSDNALAALERLTDEAKVFVVPSGAEGEENLAIERLSFTSGSLRETGEARFSAFVRNTGRRPTNGGTLEFYVNDELSKRISVGDLEAGEARGLEFVTLFETSGDVSLRAQLSQDDLNADNIRHAVAKVRPNLRVLCVQGSGGNPDVPNGSFYASNALQPRDGEFAGAVQVNTIEAADLALERLGEYDLVIASNIRNVTLDLESRLRNFVEDGGGLIVFLGDDVDPELYNKNLGTLLPATLSKTNAFPAPAELDSGASVPLPGLVGWTISEPRSEHLLAGVVARLPAPLLTGARVTQVMEAAPVAGAETIVSLDNGNPLLVSHELGDGEVLLCTTSGDATWNNFPSHPLYTILMQQATTILTSSPERLQLTVGEDVNLPIGGREVGEYVSLEEPTGEAIDLRVTQSGDQTVAAVEFKDLGVYKIAGEDQGADVVVAANVDPGEANVRVLEGAALGAQLGDLGVRILERDGSLAPAIQDTRSGRELADLLLWLAIIVFVVQAILARHFTNKMDREQTPDVAATLQMSRVAAARRS